MGFVKKASDWLIGSDPSKYGGDDPRAKGNWLTGDGTKAPAAKVPAAPDASPDLGDPVLQAAMKAQRQRLLATQGRQSTFLSGPSGDLNAPALGRKTLLGGG